MFSHMATAEKLCTRCEVKPAQGKDAYCADCRSNYQKDYRESAEWRAERRGIIRGILAMRKAVADHFRQWNGRPFMAQEVASVVESLPGPAVADEKAAVELKPVGN
jgi:hypothetical protein